MISLYSQLGFAIHPFIKSFIYLRMLRAKEDSSRLAERFGKPSRPRPDGTLVHIHAVSVGEAMSAKILFEMMRSTIPGAQILLTTGTIASAKVLEGRLPPYVIHQYYPIDTPQSVNKFISHWNPDLAIWIESEIWPLMLDHLHINGTQIILVNGRLSDKSYKTWVKIKSFAREVFSSFDLVLAQGPLKLSRFKGLGARDVKEFGNIKLLADPIAVEQSEYDALSHSLSDRKVWLAASTHEGEDELVVNTHIELLKSYKDAILLIAPRHVTRVPQIIKMVEGKGLSCCVYSKNQMPARDCSVFIMDEMGKMGALYKVSPITFVGGTYVPRGGHNPIEAAQLGSFVLHGPHTFNNQELYDALHGLSMASLVKNQDEILQSLLNPNFRPDLDWQTMRKDRLEQLEGIFADCAKKIRGVNV